MTSNPDEAKDPSAESAAAPEAVESDAAPEEKDSSAGSVPAPEEKTSQIDVSSPAKVMRIGTMVKQLLEEVRNTDLDEKGRERLAKIHRKSIDELEDGLSKDLIDELERLDLPFDTSEGPPTNSELRIAQAQLVGWLEGLFHGIQTAIMAQQAMAKQELGSPAQLPAGMVPPGAAPAPDPSADDDDKRGTGNYL